MVVRGGVVEEIDVLIELLVLEVGEAILVVLTSVIVEVLEFVVE